jgi:isopenicillin-N epimerase
LIDGAHAPGVIDIFVEGIGCDYYTGNCHKWLFCSKGAAFLWVSKSVYECCEHSESAKNKHNSSHNIHPQPAVISSTGKHDFLGRFEYTGTRDYIAYCTISSGLEFIEKKLSGVSTMRGYCTKLLSEGCQYLVKEWKTGFLVPLTMNGFMANIILPSTNCDLLDDMENRLLEDYKITIAKRSVYAREDYEQPNQSMISSKDSSIVLFPEEHKANIYFIRISAQVYIEMKDFVKLGDAVKEILQLN